MLVTVKSEIYYFQEFCIKNLKLNKIHQFDAMYLDFLAGLTPKFQPNIIYILLFPLWYRNLIFPVKGWP